MIKTFAYAISGQLNASYTDPSTQQALSKFDIVVLNFWISQKAIIEETLAGIRSYSPDVRIGNYTIIEETKNAAEYNDGVDKYNEVVANGWWLLDGNGQKIEAYTDTCAINGSRHESPNNKGQWYPQWLAQRDYDQYFTHDFDIWFMDNVRRESIHQGDWTGNGVVDESRNALALDAYRGMYYDYIEVLRKLNPDIKVMGNTPHDQTYYPKNFVDIGLFEGAMGMPWSIPAWEDVMHRYNSMCQRSDEVVFNVQGDTNDGQLLRYGLCSCLLNDGYFSYTNSAVGNVLPDWYDIYDTDLGSPVTDMYKHDNGIWGRRYEKATVLVNPTDTDQMGVPAHDGAIIAG